MHCKHTQHFSKNTFPSIQSNKQNNTFSFLFPAFFFYPSVFRSLVQLFLCVCTWDCLCWSPLVCAPCTISGWWYVWEERRRKEEKKKDRPKEKKYIARRKRFEESGLALWPELGKDQMRVKRVSEVMKGWLRKREENKLERVEIIQPPLPLNLCYRGWGGMRSYLMPAGLVMSVEWAKERKKELGIWGNNSIYIIFRRIRSSLMPIVEGNRSMVKVSAKEDLWSVWRLGHLKAG